VVQHWNAPVAEARRHFRGPTRAVSPTGEHSALGLKPQRRNRSLVREYPAARRRFAEAAQQQEQLKALVAALERDNEHLRREVEELRTERAGVAEVLRALADDLNPTPDES